MIVPAILAILGAIGSLFVKKYSLSLLLTALAVVSIWPDHVATGEWVVFVVLFLAGLVPALVEDAGRHRKPIAIGLFVLVTTVLLATPLNLFSGWGWVGLLAFLLVCGALAALFVGKGAALGAVAALMACIIAIGSLVVLLSSQQGLSTTAAIAAEPTSSTQGPTSPASPTAAPTGTVCAYGAAGWEPSASYQVIAGGLPRDTPENAKAAALAAAQTNPVFVAGYAMVGGMGNGAYIDATTLVKDGCWTEQGHELSLKVQGLIEASKASFGTAPSSATNSGGHDGRFVAASSSGISGDRTSLDLQAPDGAVTQTMVRCGNIVREGFTPAIPRGPTDQPPPTTPKPTTPTPVCLPPTPYGTWPVCKDAPTRDPQQQGNNRPGGGGVAPAAPTTASKPSVASPKPTAVYTPPPAPAPSPSALAPGATPLPSRTTPPPPPPPTSNPSATVVPSGTPTCDPRVCG